MVFEKVWKILAHGAPVVIFVVLVGASAWAGVGSYCATASAIESDLRKALADTIAERGGYYAATDTVRTFRRMRYAAGGDVAVRVADATFRSRLAERGLRDRAFLEVAVLDGDGVSVPSASVSASGLATDPVVLRSDDSRTGVVLRGCSGCSRASVLAMSDQRLSVGLFVSALLWAFGWSVRRRRCNHDGRQELTFGGLTLTASGDCFLSSDGLPLRLTPMQHRLLTMFFAAEGHRLSHKDICDALWPKKPDASDTLYTLVRRLRCVVERSSRLRIEADRGQAYRLVDR